MSPQNNDSPLIELEHVGKTYTSGRLEYHALRDINLTINAGELAAIIGPSGSGKSTMMHLIGLLDSTTEGTYRLNGQDVNQLNTNQRAALRNCEIGFVFQEFFLLSRLTALENTALPLRYQHKKKVNIKDHVLPILRKVDMQDHIHHLPNELSGGQKQRVAIARALVTQPSIILADEPTGALDSKTGKKVLALMKDLNRELGTTTIIVTHDDKVAAACDRVIRVEDGEINTSYNTESSS